MATLAPGVARWQSHVLMTSPPSIFTPDVHGCTLGSRHAFAPAMREPAIDSMKLAVPVLATALFFWGYTITGGNYAPLPYCRIGGLMDAVSVPIKSA